MLSTHIMQEVEAMCDRVIIINKGEIVADKPTQEIKESKSSNQIITVEFDKPTSKNSLLNINGITGATNVKGNVWQLTTSSSSDIRVDIFQFAVQNQLAVLTLQKEEQNLEDVFRELTK